VALAEYTPQPYKFNRFNNNGLFGRDSEERIAAKPLLGLQDTHDFWFCL
jgi:hypothetical protein